jgi:hypothetical protein
MTHPDEGPDDRAAHWWHAVETEIARRQAPRDGGDGPLPDPWADAAPHVAPLTDEQRELLVRVADQPEVARLHHLEALDLADDDTPLATATASGERSPLAAILDQAVADLTRASGEGGDEP